MTADLPDKTFLSIVVPAYNEARRIGDTVRRLSAYLEEKAIPGEIIVVDDGSQDDTAKVAEAAPRGAVVLRVLRLPVNRGKGFAVKSGVLDATGELICFTDADLSVPVCEFDRFAARASRGADVVIGSRRLHGSPLRRWAPGFLRVSYRSQIKVHQPFHRELLGETYQGFTRAFLGLRQRDSNCGFKCFRREAALAIFQRVNVERWGVDAEILLIAKRCGLRVEELEVEWHNDPASKVNLLVAPFSSLAELLRIKLNDLRGKYRPGATDRR
jgi:glycosyltransferase involved in cell wall biosynthesis